MNVRRTVSVMRVVGELPASHPGVVRVVRDLSRGDVLLGEGRSACPAASAIKVPLLAWVLQHVQDRRMSLGERVPVRAENRVPGLGVLHALDAGLTLTCRDVPTLMTIVSDSTATNLVVERVRPGDVNAFSRDASLHGTESIGPLQLPPERQNTQQRGGAQPHHGSDQAKLLYRLVRSEFLMPGMTSVALGIMAGQQHLGVIGRSVPRHRDRELPYRVASRTGELLGARLGAGIVWTLRLLVPCSARGAWIRASIRRIATCVFSRVLAKRA